MFHKLKAPKEVAFSLWYSAWGTLNVRKKNSIIKMGHEEPFRRLNELILYVRSKAVKTSQHELLKQRNQVLTQKSGSYR